MVVDGSGGEGGGEGGREREGELARRKFLIASLVREVSLRSPFSIYVWVGVGVRLDVHMYWRVSEWCACGCECVGVGEGGCGG